MLKNLKNQQFLFRPDKRKSGNDRHLRSYTVRTLEDQDGGRNGEYEEEKEEAGMQKDGSMSPLAEKHC
jgi:hypothetical protein